MNRFRLFLLVVLLIGAGVAGTALAALNAAPAAAAADTDTLELLSKMVAPTAGIAVQGNYAYFGEGNQLAVADVSAPARPVIVGRSPELPGEISALAVAGNYAYVNCINNAGEDSKSVLYILDISVPAAPALVGQFVIEDRRIYHDPVVTGTTVILLTYSNVEDDELILLDASNPAAPVEIGSYNIDEAVSAIAVAQDTLYAVSNAYFGPSTLHILDISNPAAPEKVGSVVIEMQDLWTITVSGNYAYLAGFYGLQVIDISNPATPVAVGGLDFSGNWSYFEEPIFISNDLVYTRKGYSLKVIDVSNPTAPALVGEHEFQDDEWAFKDGKVFATDQGVGKFAVYHFTNPATMKSLGHIEMMGSGSVFAYENGYIYLLGGEDYHYSEAPYHQLVHRLKILHVSEPDNPSFVEGHDLAFPYSDVNSLDVEGVLAHIDFTHINFNGASHFYHLGDFTSPQLMSGYSKSDGLASGWQSVQMEQHRAYVRNGCELKIFSLLHPDNPTRLAKHDLAQLLEGSCPWQTVSGHLAYLWDYQAEMLSILDLSNPNTPVVVGQVEIPANSYSPVVSGNYAFLQVHSGGDGWIIFDISDPAAPAEVGFLPMPEGGRSTEIVTEGAYAYLASGVGVSVYDLSDPSAPERVAAYDTTNCAAVQVSGDLIYCAGESAFLILRHHKENASPAASSITSPAATGNRVFLPIAQHAGAYRWPNTTRVSVDSSGRQANGASTATDLTPDGRFVVFDSEATNLVPGDTNGKLDVFIHDRHTRQTTRVSVASNGAQGNNVSWGGRITADGRYVVFNSYATTLVPGDTNDLNDVFLHDRQTGQTTRLSLSATGAQANGRSRAAVISREGRYVAFESMATNLASGKPDGSHYGIFLLDRQTNQTVYIGDGSSPEISADGRYVAYTHFDPVGSDFEYLYLYNRLDGHKKVIGPEEASLIQSDVRTHAIASETHQVAFDVAIEFWNLHEQEWYYYSSVYNPPTNDYLIEDNIDVRGISSNGRHLLCSDYVIDSFEDGWLLAIGATNQYVDASFKRIANDGRIALFESESDIVVPGDTNGVRDVFIRDRGTPLAGLERPTTLSINAARFWAGFLSTARGALRT